MIDDSVITGTGVCLARVRKCVSLDLIGENLVISVKDAVSI